jgi:peptidyl-prolyl cis-trans isomerase SurA
MKRLLLLSVLALALPARAEIVERIAGVVNGQSIALSDVNERAQLDMQRVDKMPPGPDQDKARKEALSKALDQLVDEKLIEAEATALGLEVTEEEQNKSIEALAKQNNMTLDAFKEELVKQKLDFAQLKDTLRRQALRFKLVQAKVKPRKVSDEEIKAAYAALAANPDMEWRARHLYVRIPPNATDAQLLAAQQKAQKAAARIEAGEEFAVVARDLSDGPTAKEGGNLGWFRHGMLVPELEAAAAKLKEGQVSPLIRTASGFHFIKVESRRPLPQKSLLEMQEELRARLGQESILKEQDRFITQLRKQAQVELKL